MIKKEDKDSKGVKLVGVGVVLVLLFSAFMVSFASIGEGHEQLAGSSDKTSDDDSLMDEPASFYDRRSAYEYAYEYWDVVPSDGYFWETQTDYVELDQGTEVSGGWDCTHFISCCVGDEENQKGGGIPVPSRVPPTYGEPGAQNFVDFLLEEGYAEEVSSVDQLHVGDVIAYDHNGDGHIQHNALYLGNGEISYHSSCNFGADWELSDDETYTFLHMQDGDNGYHELNTQNEVSGELKEDDYRQYYTLELDQARDELTLDLDGSGGWFTDFDLYVSKGEEPTLSDHDKKSDGWSDTDESLTIDNPEAGTYIIMVHSDGGDGTYELNAEVIGGPTTIFEDDFEDGSLNDWSTNTNDGSHAGITSNYGSESTGSGSYSLYTCGGTASVVSPTIDINGVQDARLKTWIRRGKDSFSENPDEGEDLVVSYKDNEGNWDHLKTYAGGGTAGEIIQMNVELPSEAFHSDFKVMYRQTDGDPEWSDNWHMDDVKVTSTSSGGNDENEGPESSFEHQVNELNVEFTDVSSDPDGSITSWSWDFGDGTNSNEQDPTHDFDSEGTYTVSLTVEDNDGSSSTSTRDVSVSSGNDGGETSTIDEDFEDGSSAWSTNGLWHLVSENDQYGDSSSGTNAMWYGQDSSGDYDTGSHTTGSLSKSVDLSSAAEASLSFQHWYETENYDDGNYDKVKVTVNGEKVYYRDTTDDDVGSEDNFVEETIDISSYAGQTVEIEFTFDSIDDYNNDYRGWYVDDVKVSSGSEGDGDDDDNDDGGNDGLNSIYTQGFEGDPSGYSTTGLWHTVDENDQYGDANDGSNAIWYGQDSTGTYDTGSHTRGVLTLPTIDLLEAAQAELSFSHWFRTEDYDDEFDQVKVTVNGEQVYYRDTSDDNVGSEDDFVKETIDLSSYTGQTVTIKFIFDSIDDYDNGYRGWYVDDIEVKADAGQVTSTSEAAEDFGGASYENAPTRGEATKENEESSSLAPNMLTGVGLKTIFLLVCTSFCLVGGGVYSLRSRKKERDETKTKRR